MPKMKLVCLIVIITASLVSHVSGQKYTLIVNEGSGDGDYEKETKVNIKANVRPGEQFKEWKVVPDSDIIADRTSASTTLTMPGRNVDVTAIYRAKKYKVEVIDGDGDGTYEAEEDVTIKAYKGWEPHFFRWMIFRGGVWELFTREKTPYTFKMPTFRLLLKAEYLKYKVEVIDGSRTGFYEPGKQVTITSQLPKGFDGWEVKAGKISLKDATAKTTTFKMPKEFVRVKAIQKTKGPAGSPSDSETPTFSPSTSSKPSFTATPSLRPSEVPSKVPSLGPSEVPSEGPSVSTPPTSSQLPSISPSATSIPTDAPSPSPSISPSATFAPTGAPSPSPSISPSVTSAPTNPKYILIVINGSGGGDYDAGETIQVIADELPGREFDRWRADFGDPTFTDIELSITTLTMLARDVDIVATYKTLQTDAPSDSPTSATQPPSFMSSSTPSVFPSNVPTQMNMMQPDTKKKKRKDGKKEKETKTEKGKGKGSKGKTSKIKSNRKSNKHGGKGKS